MTSSTHLRELARRLIHVTPTPVRTQSLQSPCTILVQDFKLLPHNNMKAANPKYHPSLCTLEPIYTHPIGRKIGAKPLTMFGASFPVAPNILLTAAHSVYNAKYIDAGYEVALIESSQPQYSQKSICTIIPYFSAKKVVEKDPITNAEWILPKDYIFLHIPQQGPRWPNFLLPKAAREGDVVVFPSVRPDIIEDIDLVADTRFSLSLAFQNSGLTEEQANSKISNFHIDISTLVRLVGTEDLVQGEGRVIKAAHGLIAHNSPFFRGMSGTFGSVAPGTFSCIGISAGLGITSPGTNYNVGVDINRADFKEDYANIVLPHLPHDARLEAEKFLKGI